MAWPYLIGFDTIRYSAIIQDGQVFSFGIVGFLRGANLFYAMATLLYVLTNDVVLVLKALGPLLLGVLCFMMYYYARRALNWTGWKALLLAILAATYFVSLRNSWDLYRQTVGLAFLMAALIFLKSYKPPKKYYLACVFMALAVLSHELAAVILFFFVGLEAMRFLVKRSPKESGYLVITAILPLALFLFQRYSPPAGAVILPSESVAIEPSIDLVLYMGGLLVYCYAIILPFVLLGLPSLKDSALRYWTLLCLGVLLLEMLNPNLPFYLWYRWVLILVYPLLFFSVEGLEKLWRFSSRFENRVKRSIPKILVATWLFSLLTLSGFYLTTGPENAFPYFSKYNSYLSSIPSSMLQNSISIQDNPSMVKCLNWIDYNTTGSSVVIEHYALYDSAALYLHNRIVVPIIQDPSTWSNAQNVTSLTERLVLTAKEALAGGHDAVYTVWWISGKGWYGIPSLPLDFKEVHRSGNMAVYSYAPAQRK